MQRKMVHVSKIALTVVLLSLHVQSFGVVAYIPQALRVCLDAAYHAAGQHSRKEALEELHGAMRENRMLASDKVVSQAVEEAIEVVRAHKDQSEVVEYLEQYHDSLQDRGILLALDGDASHQRSWSMGLVSRAMHDQQVALDLVCLSNELSDNLILCGAHADKNADDSRAILRQLKPNPISDPVVNFRPSDMATSQSVTPSICVSGTGVGCPVVVGWDLMPSNDVQSPVNMQFYLPGNLAKDKPVTLELVILVPCNASPDGYANIQVLSRYVRSTFDINNVDWTATNTSGNVQITASSVPGNLQYITVEIPLTSQHLKAGYFALLSVSRVAPTDSQSEFVGELCLVSAVYRYTAKK